MIMEDILCEREEGRANAQQDSDSNNQYILQVKQQLYMQPCPKD